MEYTREIYWNVGHGALTLVPMYLLVCGAIGFMIFSFLRRRTVYRQGKSLPRHDNPGSRAATMLVNVLLQKQVVRVAWPGLLHGLLFWGFFLLVIGTTLVFIQADFTDPLFGLVFLKGAFYKIFSVTLDIAGLIAMLMLGGLGIRRFVFRPKGLETKIDDVIMHALLSVILIAGFVIEGSRMAVTELGTPLAAWSPVGHVFALLLAPLGQSELLVLHKTVWWFHLLLVATFFMIIPFTKFRHILTTSAGYFFADRGPKGKLTTLDIEDENAETFGARTVSELSWKDLFDGDACTLCTRCQDRCPAYATSKPLSPMQVVNRISGTAFHNPEDNLIDIVGKDELWACTTCRACEQICPAAIEHVGKIVQLRRSLVLMEGEFPGDEVLKAMKQTEVNGNPLGNGYAERGNWAAECGVKTIDECPEADILYFVGCYASFDTRNIAVAKSFVSLCRAAGVKVAILGKKEKCCGEPMRKMGNEYLYHNLAMENIERLTSCAPRTIVTTCPHCYTTLTKDYRDLGFTGEVLTYTVFLKQLLSSGRLRLNSETFSCTYHDSCYLGRHNDIYEPPRALIRAAGGHILEMEKCRTESFCCGAGGGRIMAEERIGERINVKRVEMAASTGAPQLVSNCPFCLTMFEDGVKGAGVEERVRAKDIAELLCERVMPRERMRDASSAG